MQDDKSIARCELDLPLLLLLPIKRIRVTACPQSVVKRYFTRIAGIALPPRPRIQSARFEEALKRGRQEEDLVKRKNWDLTLGQRGAA